MIPFPHPVNPVKKSRRSLIGRWIWNLLISVDQLGNTISFGDPDETISSRIGRIKRAYGGHIPWYRPVAKSLDWALEIIQRRHCLRSIERGEGENGIIDKPGQLKPRQGPQLPPREAISKKGHRYPISPLRRECNGMRARCNGIPKQEVSP
jgi:hypothetical protein